MESTNSVVLGPFYFKISKLIFLIRIINLGDVLET